MELAIDQQSKERGALPQQPSRSDRLHQLMRGAPTTSGPAMIENPMRTTSKDDDVARARFPVRAPDADDADDSEVAEDADDREAEDHFPVPAAPGSLVSLEIDHDTGRPTSSWIGSVRSVSATSTSSSGRSAAGANSGRRVTSMDRREREHEHQQLASMKWCTGGSVTSVFVVVLAEFLLLFMFVFHATPICDELIDERGTREIWLGIGLDVQVMVGLLSVFGFIYGGYILAEITCRWRRTISVARRHRHEMERDSRLGPVATYICLWYRYVVFWKGTQSPYFLRVLLAYEAFELGSQLLALEQYSVSGVSRSFLAIYAGAIALNAMTPVVLVIAHNRFGTHEHRDRLALWIRRLMLWDCFCDLLYSAFPLINLFSGYFELFLGRHAQGAEEDILRDACTYIMQANGQERLECPMDPLDMRAYMLLSEGGEALLGGGGASVALKLITRVFPLLQAIYKARIGFRSRYVISGAEFTRGRRKAVSGVAAQPCRQSIRREQQQQQGQTGSGGLAVSAMKRRSVLMTFVSAVKTDKAKLKLAKLNRGDDLDGQYYRHVPLWVAILITSVVTGLIGGVWARLATWPTCPLTVPSASCIKPAFPILRLPTPLEGCACNTLVWSQLKSRCPAANATTSTACTYLGTDIEDCSVREFAQHPETLRHAAIVMLLDLCPSDTKWFSTVLDAANPNAAISLMLMGKFVKRQRYTEWSFKNSLIADFRAASNATNATSTSPIQLPVGVAREGRMTSHGGFGWELPPSIGRLTNLHVLAVDGLNVTGFSRDLDWSLLESLIELRVASNPELRGEVPASLAELPHVKQLFLWTNSFTSIHPDLGKLTTLVGLDFTRNYITAIPSSLGGLSSLQRFEMQGNQLTIIPDEFALSHSEATGGLQKLYRLMIYGNMIGHFPVSMLALPALDRFDFDMNNLSTSMIDTAVAFLAERAPPAEGGEQKCVSFCGNPGCANWTSSVKRVIGSWDVYCDPHCRYLCSNKIRAPD